MIGKIIEALYRLKAYVPVFQTFFWFLFYICLLCSFKKQINNFLDCIIDKIKKGSGLKVGSFFELSETLHNFPTIDEKASSSCEINQNENFKSLEDQRSSIYKNNYGIFITHLVFPSKTKSDNYDIFIYLIEHKNKDNPSKYSDITKVEFYFGHMWNCRVFPVQKTNNVFGIHVSAYAPFLCLCRIHFVNADSITLNRYIDFEITKLVEFNT